MQPRVSINIVAWNSVDYLPDLLESIAAQTDDRYQVLVIDNASNDGVREYVRRHHPNIAVLRNARNLGFAAAHNQGIRYVLDHWPEETLEDRYILVTNPDIILQPDFLERLLERADTHPDGAAFGGKLLRAYGENLQDEVLQETVASDRLDSTGLRAHKSRRFSDRGAGEMDTGQYDEEEEVFGVSGALACYRASALRDVEVSGEWFDEDFFAYKEDIDLAWRLRLYGWEAWYIPTAQAYHYRGMFGAEATGLWERLQQRRDQSSVRRFFSTRNHLNLLMKNMSIGSVLLAAPRILWQEAGRLAATCALAPKNLLAYPQALARFPRMWKKRRAIMQNASVRSTHLRKWFE